MGERTTVVNLRKDEYDVYIGRPGRGEDGYFGNPFPVRDWRDPVHLAAVMAQYRAHFEQLIATDAEFKRRVLQLRGKRLGCFCAPGPCHGDVIAEWVDAQPVDQAQLGGLQPLLALTLHRPWPWAVMHAGKPIENRGWDPPRTIVGKHIALHAGLNWDGEAARWIAATFNVKVPFDSEHPTGIVGVVKVLGVRHEGKGDPWFFGPAAWEFGDVVELAKPVPCKGAQKLWRVPDHLLPELRKQYAAARARRAA